MKKIYRAFEIIALILFVLSVTTCNWMTNDLSKEIENEVKVATAEQVKLYVRFADNNFGTTNPSGATTQKVDVSFDISAVPNNNYGFYEWAAFSSEVVDPSKNNPGLLYTNDDEYSAYERLPSDIVRFEPNGRDATTTTVTILQKRDDIVIVPMVAKRAVLSNRNTYPKVGTEDVVRNQRIVISFDKEMDFSSFVNYSGSSYDWDRNKIQIRVYDQSGKYIGEDESYSYFDLPVQDSSDLKKIIITPKRSVKLPRYASVEIIISYDVSDTEGYHLADSIEYYYSVGKTDDEGYPIFTEITGGRPRSGEKDTYKTNENGEQVIDKHANDWSDFYGYRDESNQITELIPEDSLKLESWENTPINEIFKNRITDSVNLCVRIQDTTNAALSLNTAATDKDISNFTVKVKHLVYPDGSDGTGKYYDNNEDHDYYYDGMRYSEGDTEFESKSVSSAYEAPDGAFAFTYYLPKDIPDGLLKIEFYASDYTGNSGEEKPYAVYVIKDTTAPKLNLTDESLTQMGKVQAGEASILSGSKWYNKTTIGELKFKAASPIVDTYGEKLVAEKFRLDGYKTADSGIYWSFGPSADMMGEMKQIDNSGVNTYSLATIKDVIKTQGTISVNAKLKDDLGNTSDLVSLNLDVSYDTVSPDVVTITDLNEASVPSGRSYYPLTGTSGSAGKTFFTRNASANMTVTSKDSGSALETATSSGIEGFFVTDHVLTSEELAGKLAVSNGKLTDIQKTGLQNGAINYSFSAGATPNGSKKDYYLYAVDRALNASENPTKISVIQDTTGPGIAITDSASYVYDAGNVWFRSSDAKAEKTLVKGTTGSVTGLVNGTYYYGASDSSFPLKVTLKNECGEYDSGSYYFSVVSESGTEVNSYGKQSALSSSGEEVRLETGNYKIVALDNLGNETETALFHVKQDDGKPVVENLVINGKEANGTPSTTAATKREVTISFDTADMSGTVNTGIRKIYLKGVLFDGMKVYADNKLLELNNHYVTETENGFTVIALKSPISANTSFRIENIKLTEDEGQKTVQAYVTDAVRNRTETDKTATIFLDATAPAVSEVTLVSSDADYADANKETATKTAVVSARIKAFDGTSGVKRIYINKQKTEASSTYEAPTADTLLSADSVVKVNGVVKGTYDAATKAIVLTEPLISTTDTTFEVTGVNLPDTSVQGTQTVAVYVFDDSGLRAESPAADSIIYDTTGPAIEVEDNSSETYNGIELKHYRSNGVANDVTAVTGVTGQVTGLVTGTYYYSKSETTGLKIKVNLTDKNTTNVSGTSSGAYKFYIDDNSTDLKDSGSEVYLTAGDHTITALDNLGNKTVSETIKVVQDTSAPAVDTVRIHGKIQGDAESVSSTKENDVYVTFNVKDNTSANNDTGLLKITLSGEADFSSAELYEGNSKVNVIKNRSSDNSSVEFWFASPVTDAKSYTVKGIVLSTADGMKTVTVKAADRTANECTGVSGTIFKDTTAPVTSDVIIISTDEYQLGSKGYNSFTNDEKVTVSFKTYDITSGIKKITICDVNGNSLLTSESEVTMTYNGSTVTSAAVLTAGAIVFDNAGTLISASTAKPYTFTVTNVSMPKTDGKIAQGNNFFYVKVYDDVLNVADSAASSSIVYDSVPPVPVVDMQAPEHFNPYKAFRGSTSTSKPQYYDPVRKTFWTADTSYYYVSVQGDDSTADGTPSAGFWKSSYSSSSDSSETVLYKDGSTVKSYIYYSTATTYNIYAYDGIGNKSVPSEADHSKVYIKRDTYAPSSVTFGGFYDKDGNKLSSKYHSEKGTVVYTNSDSVTIKFSAKDDSGESGISYFDFSGSFNYSFKDGSATGSDYASLGYFMAASKKAQLWIDGKQYYRGGYDRTTGEYTDGPSEYEDFATYRNGKWYIGNTSTETENVYINNYMNLTASVTGKEHFRCYGLYNVLSAGETHNFEVRNIDLSGINQSYMCFNIYVYDLLLNSKGTENNKLVYDPNKPVITNTYFKANKDGAYAKFTSNAELTNHDLYITFGENFVNQYSQSGVEKIELELTSSIPANVTGTLDASTEYFKVYVAGSDGDPLRSITSSYYELESKTGKLTINFKPGSSESAGYGNYSYESISEESYHGTANKTNVYVIKGLTIAGGTQDQDETITVKVTDRAGNVSTNETSFVGKNKAVICYDSTAPELHRTEYCDDAGNPVIIDGAPAVSYFKTVLGNPAVLSTHTVGYPYKDGTVAKTRKISVFPNPGDTVKNASVNAATGWFTGEGTELVLSFKKKGSGIQSVTFSSADASRGMFFNKSTVDVTINNHDGQGPIHLTKNTDYVIEDQYQEFENIYLTLRFTNPDKCPRGENAAAYIKGVVLDRTQAAESGENVYGTWCTNVTLKSFAGATTYYDGKCDEAGALLTDHEPGWILCAGIDYDTPEFTYKTISFRDTTVYSSGSTVTNGNRITMSGRIQSLAKDITFSSGLWAIHLDKAKFVTEGANKSEFSVQIFTTSKYSGEFSPNILVNGANLTYKFASGKDFSKRFMPETAAGAYEVAEFNRNNTASDAAYSVSDDGHTMYLNIPVDPQNGTDFTITNLQLDNSLPDGATDIKVTLYKYSGLSNDADNRIYVKGTDKNPAASGKKYALTRRASAFCGSSKTSKDCTAFADNRTNRVTLDRTPPVITWNGYSSTNSTLSCYMDKTDPDNVIVYYPYSNDLTVSYSFADNDGSGIKGMYFGPEKTGSTIADDYKSATSSSSLSSFNSTNEAKAFTRYLHVMDKAGNVTSRPVTYEAYTESSVPSKPTSWKLDKTVPSNVTGTLLHYYGSTPASRYVLKHNTGNEYYVYHNAATTEVSGSFADTPVSGETGGIAQFFEDTGSGLYGTSSSASTAYSSIDTDFKWSTSDSYHYIYDKVGNHNAFVLTKLKDSAAPTLTLTGATGLNDKTVYKNFTTLSKDSVNTIFLNSKEKDDGVKLTFTAADSGDNATGIYKVTVGGAAAGTDGASVTLSGSTVTWNLGAGETKGEGDGNGLTRTITVTDYVGNETTYSIKLVSDTTAPKIEFSESSPFAKSTDEKKYLTKVDEDGKLTLYFSPAISDYNWGEGSLTIPLTVTGLSDANGSGLSDVKWYSDKDCTSEITEITLRQRYQNGRAQTPQVEPVDKSVDLFAKDNVGNLLKLHLTQDKTQDIEFIYFSSTNSLFIPYGDGWYGSKGVADGNIIFGAADNTLYLDKSSKETTFTVAVVNGTSYTIKEGTKEKTSGKLGWVNGYVDSFKCTLETGKTYTVVLANYYDARIEGTTVKFTTVLDNQAPSITGNYVTPHSWEDSDGNRYYTAANNGTIYINDDGSAKINLSNDLLSDTGSGVKGWYTGKSEDSKVESITLTKETSSQTVYLVDNAGNFTYKTFSVTLDNTAPVYTKASGSDLFAIHDYSDAAPYMTTAENKVIFTGSSVELDLPSLSDGGAGTNGTWSVVSGPASISGSKVTFTGTGTVTLAAYDNVHNEMTVAVNAIKAGDKPDISLTKAASDIDNGTAFSAGSYKVYTKESAAVFTVTKTNAVDGFTKFTCGADEITGDTLSVGTGTYVIKASDELGRSNSYNLEVVVDQTAPSAGNIISGQHLFTESEPYFAASAGNAVVVNGSSSATFTLPEASDGDGCGVDGWYAGSSESGSFTKVTGSLSVSGETWLCLKDKLGNTSSPFQFASVDSTSPALAKGYAGTTDAEGKNVYTAQQSVFTTWYSGDKYPAVWNGSSNFKAAGTNGGDASGTSNNNLVAAAVTETGSGIYQLVLKSTVANPSVNWIGYATGSTYNDQTQIAGAQDSNAKYKPLNSVQIDSSSYIKGWSVQTSGTANADGTYTTVITLPYNPYVVTPTSDLKDKINSTTGTAFGSGVTLSSGQYIFVFGKNIGSSLEVIDFAGNSSGGSVSVNASVIARAGRVITNAGKAIGSTTTTAVRSTVETIRKAFVPEPVTDTVQKTRKNKKEIQKAVTKAAESVSVIEDKKAVTEIVNEVVEVAEKTVQVELPELIETANVAETVEAAETAENTGLITESVEITTMTESEILSDSLNKVEVSIANTSDGDYNYNRIVKSVVIILISLISLVTMLIIVIRNKKSRE